MRKPACILSALILASAIIARGQEQQAGPSPQHVDSVPASQLQADSDSAEAYPLQAGSYTPAVDKPFSKINWTRAGFTIVATSVTRLGIDAGLKHWINEERPDKSARNSFPSRHSSWAYGVAGTLTYYLGARSAAWPLATHFLANCVGIERVADHRHWPWDVMGGAGIGLGTDYLSYSLANLIFGYENPYAGWRDCSNDFKTSVSVTTGIAFPFNGKEQNTFRPCLMTGVRLVLPIKGEFGLAAECDLLQMPLMDSEGEYYGSLTTPMLTAMAAWHHRFGSSPFALEACAGAGARYTEGFAEETHSLRPVGIASCQLTTCLTQKFLVGLEGGYTVGPMAPLGEYRMLSAASVSFLTKAYF